MNFNIFHCERPSHNIYKTAKNNIRNSLAWGVNLTESGNQEENLGDACFNHTKKTPEANDTRVLELILE